MNPKIMVRILFAALFIFTCFVLAGIIRAETATQFVVEGDKLVVRETEVTVIKVEQFLMPPNVDIPEKDLPKIHAILEQGKGDYLMDQETKMVWQWGFPMQITTREVKTVAVFQNGTWLEPKVLVGPMTAKDSWPLTVLLVIIAISVLAVSIAHQESGKSEWWLVVFYGALIAMIGSFYMSDAFAAFAAFAATAICTFAFAAFIIAFAASPTAAVAAAVVVAAATSATNNQMVEYAIFMACVIIVSYLLAKLAKQFGWIKVAGKPAS